MKDAPTVLMVPRLCQLLCGLPLNIRWPTTDERRKRAMAHQREEDDMDKSIPTIGIGGFCEKGNVGDRSRTMFLPVTEAGAPDWPLLISRVQAAWDDRRPGNRDGIVLVPLEVIGQNFATCPIVVLKEGDLLGGEFVPRRGVDELPRKQTYVIDDGSELVLASHVDVVVYRADVLDETGHRSTEMEWEVVTLLGKPTAQGEPIAPMTLSYNHFELSGGSSTGMDAAGYEEAMRESIVFWWNKARLMPADFQTRLLERLMNGEP